SASDLCRRVDNVLFNRLAHKNADRFAQQCERSYHALIAMAPINSRALSETGQSLGRSESQQFFAVNSCGR
ncbi:MULTISPECIES: hypothetical protein, partial [Burkholderia]|uniref:hypothetical protein n=2 Tax=Burkholderiaceae TaxID=119060 RepID=UPI001A9C6AF1